MRGASIITAIFVAFSFSANAYDFEKVIVRPDGQIEDSSGKIVAVPNAEDERNSIYEKYYRDATKECEAEPCPSDFSIILHPELGYIKKPTKPPVAMNNPGETAPNNGNVQNNNNVQNNTNSSDNYVNPYDSQPNMRPRY
jgi:hypothetical protein